MNFSHFPLVKQMRDTYIRYIHFFHGCKDYCLIKKSTYFNPYWYLSQYRDVAASGINPAWHYAHFGWRENRNPGPGFSTHYYLNNNSEVRKAGINPLIHYEKVGKTRGQLPKPDLPGLETGIHSPSIGTPSYTSDSLMGDEHHRIIHKKKYFSNFLSINLHETVIWQILLALNRNLFSKIIIPVNMKITRGFSLYRDGLKILKKEGPKSLVIATWGHVKNRKKTIQNPLQVKEDKMGGEYSISPAQFVSFSDATIAVHAHVYYIDLYGGNREFNSNDFQVLEVSPTVLDVYNNGELNVLLIDLTN